MCDHGSSVFRSALRLAIPAVFAVATAAPAQTVPPPFVVETLVGTALNGPTDFAFLPDGRVLFVEIDGDLKLLTAQGLTAVGTIPEVEVDALPERGVQSFCLDPDFVQNGHIYVWYTHLPTPFVRLDRFTLQGDLNNSASANLSLGPRHILLADIPDNSISHNGGTVRFGADGRLYASSGEDEQSCEAQNRTNLLGKLLRLDVGSVPPGAGGPVAKSLLAPGDNPWNSSTDDDERLLIAYGLRNPFGMAVDPLQGDLYLGDVGHDRYEEVDHYPFPAAGGFAGLNYGWPWREGTGVTVANFPPQPWASCPGVEPPGLTPPIHEYYHPGNGRSVVMGAVMRARGLPLEFGPAFEGDLFVGDYFTGRLRRLVFDGATWSVAPAVPGQPMAAWWATGIVGLVRFDVGPDGALYFIQHANPYNMVTGGFRRIRPAPTAQIAAVSGQDQRATAGEPFPAPVVVRVADLSGAPVTGAPVYFTASGPVVSPAAAPVLTDGAGLASLALVALDAGGPVAVRAVTPAGPPAGVTVSGFVRDLAVTHDSGFPLDTVMLAITNVSSAVPPAVFHIVLAGTAQPPLPTPIGPVCLDPFNPQATVVLEDSTGFLGGFEWQGGTGTPSLLNTYAIPSGLLAGATILVTAVGYDALQGWHRLDCEPISF